MGPDPSLRPGGTDRDDRLVAGLVRTCVEVHGPTYDPGKLERLALAAYDAGDLDMAGSLTRAAKVVYPDRVTDVMRDRAPRQRRTR